jgi:hypothetical protein
METLIGHREITAPPLPSRDDFEHIVVDRWPILVQIDCSNADSMALYPIAVIQRHVNSGVQKDALTLIPARLAVFISQIRKKLIQMGRTNRAFLPICLKSVFVELTV